ncbi:DUF5348 domain-containing protein [Clostridium sp.]|uniref:DUF5348 domain-containing protein n=1 Tax=Clostridium sp. TaxID=1506 RepID=UPI003F3ED24E
MRQGKIYKNEQGRYQLENDSYYWTCGDSMLVYDEDEEQWLNGRVEYGDRDYYWTNDDYDVPLYNGLEVRLED